MSTATRSDRVCRRCGESGRVLRLQWQDDVGGPTIAYDDHVCLECGLYANKSGCSLQAASLEEYRERYGYIVAPVKRFLNLLWASLPAEWETEALLGPSDPLYVEVRFLSRRRNIEFSHKFDTASIARHEEDLAKWARL